jgi:DNA-binding CsgD family transcriptional regulator
MMIALKGRDFRRALEFLNQYCSQDEPEQYVQRLLEGLYRLIPMDHWFFGNCGSPTQLESLEISQYPVGTLPATKIINELGGPKALPHPPRCLPIESATVVRISDVMTRRQFHEHPMYADYYRLIPVEDDLGCYFVDHDMVGFVAGTRSSNVGSHELELAKLVIRPALAGLRNARSIVHMRNQRDLLMSAIEKAPVGVIVATQNGEILSETAEARRLLLFHFGRQSFTDRLPDPLIDYISNRRELLRTPGKSSTAEAFRLNRGDRVLKVSALLENAGFILSLHEESAIPDLDHLVKLGLSKREAEVLELVAMGKTNAEIGIILGISRLTVGKHMQHILFRLNVETRTAAAAAAIEAWHGWNLMK